MGQGSLYVLGVQVGFDYFQQFGAGALSCLGRVVMHGLFTLLGKQGSAQRRLVSLVAMIFAGTNNYPHAPIGTTEFVIVGLLTTVAADLGTSLRSAGLLVSPTR